MSAFSVKPSQSQNVSKCAGKGAAHAGEMDLAVFNLRDTLSGIVVREANFGEFLSALKQFGMHTAKQ